MREWDFAQGSFSQGRRRRRLALSTHRVASTMEVYFLIVLEAGRPRSVCRQIGFFGVLCPWFADGYPIALASRGLSLTRPHPWCLLLCPRFFFSRGHQSVCTCTHPTVYFKSIPSLKVPSPNPVTLCRPGDEGFHLRVWGRCRSARNNHSWGVWAEICASSNARVPRAISSPCKPPWGCYGDSKL